MLWQQPGVPAECAVLCCAVLCCTLRLRLLGCLTAHSALFRSQELDPTGKFMYSLNQRADNIATFRIQPNGVPKFTGKFLFVGSPAAMVFLP